MIDLDHRCRSLLGDLQRRRRDWLPLGPVRTIRSPEVYLRAGFLRQWELYVRETDGSLELGPAPDSVRLFDPSGDFRARVRAHPGLRAEPIAAAFVSRIAALDAFARQCFAALVFRSTTLTAVPSKETRGRFGEAFFSIEYSGGAVDSISRLEREAVVRWLWDALFAGRELQPGDVERWGAAARALLEPEALFARVMARDATVNVDGATFQKIYRRADRELVMLVPSGEIVSGYYPGDGCFVDPVDGDEYIEKPCSEDELRQAVSSREVLFVKVGVPEETGGRAVW